MSNSNTEDHGQSAYVQFPDEFITELRQIIEDEFSQSTFGWLKFTFWMFAKAYINDHFFEYPTVLERQQLEEHIERVKAGLEVLQLDLRRTLDSRYQLKLRRDRQADEINRKIKELYDEIAKAEEAKNSATQNLRQLRIDEWYRHKLVDEPIRPSTIPGIGPTRVSALDHADIRTAADIVPENEYKGKWALQRVRGAHPDSEWRDLRNWREKLKQRMPSPMIKEPTQEEIQAVRDEQELKRARLERTLDEKKKELDAIHDPTSSASEQITENESVEEELRERITERKSKLAELQYELSLYEFITPDMLLERILRA